MIPEKSTEELLKSLNQVQKFEDYLSENAPHFCQCNLPELLSLYMEEKEMRKADIIKSSGLSEIYIYEIFAGKKMPSRNSLIRICFSLLLSQEEMQQLMKYAGYPPLYPRNPRDGVILFAADKKMSLLELEELLTKHQMEGLRK